MNCLLRSAALLTAMTLPVIAAHAAPVTYTGTVSLVDTTTGATIGTFPNSGAFSFNDPLTGTFLDPFVDPFSIDGRISNGDQISLDVTFSAPGTGNGDLAGEDIKGTFGSNSIDWSYPADDQIDLTNGSVAVVSLPNFFGAASTPLSGCGVRDSDLCGSSDVSIYVTDNDPVASPTPEPSSLMLLGTGVLGAAGMIRRRLAV